MASSSIFRNGWRNPCAARKVPVTAPFASGKMASATSGMHPGRAQSSPQKQSRQQEMRQLPPQQSESPSESGHAHGQRDLRGVLVMEIERLKLGNVFGQRIVEEVRNHVRVQPPSVRIEETSGCGGEPGANKPPCFLPFRLRIQRPEQRSDEVIYRVDPGNHGGQNKNCACMFAQTAVTAEIPTHCAQPKEAGEASSHDSSRNSA